MATVSPNDGGSFAARRAQRELAEAENGKPARRRLSLLAGDTRAESDVTIIRTFDDDDGSPV